MAKVQNSVEVEVPVTTAYNQWTQFETFPSFMEGVRAVQQVDDVTLDWTADIGGKIVEWKARITEQVPDERIAWRNVSGATNAGLVLFEPVGSDKCRVTLQIETEPSGALEKIGDLTGFVTRQVNDDLQHFKDFIEGRRVETGAWRGSVGSTSGGPGRQQG